MTQSSKNSLAPWLEIPDGPRALAFYKSAFDAEETYRYDNSEGGFVVRLNANGAEFWLSYEGRKSGGEPSADTDSPTPLGGKNLRLILTVPDPDALFAKALAAGATRVYAVSEGHGWRIGRLIDPFGLHWEIGKPL